MSLRNLDDRNVSSTFTLPLSLKTVLQVGMDGSNGSSSRLQSDRPPKASRQTVPGKFQPLITDLEMVVKPPLFFKSPNSLEDKAQGLPYSNVPFVEDYKREWSVMRFSYQTLIDNDRATPIKISGTLDSIVAQLAAYMYRGSPLLDIPTFFKVVDALNSIVFTPAEGGGPREALTALRESTRLFEIAPTDAVIANLQNHEGTISLPLLLYLHNALSDSSNKKEIQGLFESLAAAGVQEMDVYVLWYEIHSIVKIFSGYPNFPILQINNINTYITDLFEIDPRPNADYAPNWHMAAQEWDVFQEDDEGDDGDDEMEE